MKKNKKQLEKLQTENANLESKVTLLEERVITLTKYKEANQKQIGATMSKLNDMITEARGPPVADTKEPKPQKEEERVEHIVSESESSLSETNTTTGGVAGDSDGDADIESLNVSEMKPQREVGSRIPDKSSEESQDSDHRKEELEKKKKS